MRKRVSTIRFNLQGDPPTITGIGQSPRGTRYGHTVLELKKGPRSGRPTQNEIAQAVGELLGPSPKEQ